MIAGKVEQQLVAMAQLQDSLNANVHPQWRDQDHAYYRAIWVECAELLDHFGWKWWKHQSTDLEQVKLEIVDIWHFGLSQLIREGRADGSSIDESVVSAFQRIGAEPAGEFREAVETLASAVLAQHDFPVNEFVKLMAALPLDFDELYRMYIGKNVLNNFRQANGYKSGTYIKVWLGREDNEHLFELVGELDDASGSFPDELYRALESRYAATKRA